MLAAMRPFFPNLFWQATDGAAILQGHFPHAVAGATTDAPLLAHEWLFEAAAAWCVAHGAFGLLALACALAAAATPLLAYAAARAFGSSDLAAGIAAFLALGSRLTASALRPETFAVDLFALELLLLARGAPPWTFALPAVLWANLHASAVLAPVPAVLSAAVWLWERERARARGAAGGAAAAAAGTLLTPHGAALWTYAWSLAVAPSAARTHLEAWAPLAPSSLTALLVVLPGLALLALGRPRWAGPLRAPLLLAALFAVMTVAHERYAVFLSVAWAPALAGGLDRRGPLAGWSARAPAVPALLLLPLAVFAVPYGAGAARARIDPPGPWSSAAAIVAAHGLRGDAYADYVWGAYLPFRRLPVRLLIDAHGDAFAADVWRDHLALERAGDGWRAVLRRRAIGLVIVPAGAKLSAALAREAGWRTVDVRDGVAVYARSTSSS